MAEALYHNFFLPYLIFTIELPALKKRNFLILNR